MKIKRTRMKNCKQNESFRATVRVLKLCTVKKEQKFRAQEALKCCERFVVDDE